MSAAEKQARITNSLLAFLSGLTLLGVVAAFKAESRLSTLETNMTHVLEWIGRQAK